MPLLVQNEARKHVVAVTALIFREGKVLAMRRAISEAQRRLAAHLCGFSLTENSFIVRRTGQPALTPVTGTQIPARLPYPPQENLYNPANYKLMDQNTKMWWMP
jgi:hypothetical protein